MTANFEGEKLSKEISKCDASDPSYILEAVSKQDCKPGTCSGEHTSMSEACRKYSATETQFEELATSCKGEELIVICRCNSNDCVHNTTVSEKDCTPCSSGQIPMCVNFARNESSGAITGRGQSSSCSCSAIEANTLPVKQTNECCQWRGQLYDPFFGTW